MRIIVLGAGALGSIIAAGLIRAGHDVVVLARGVRAKQVRADGLKVTGKAEIEVPAHIFTDPASVKQADALIVALKTYHNDDALAGLGHVQVDSVVSVQNGLKKNDDLAATFGASNVVGCAAMFGGEVAEDGSVNYTLDDDLFIGELSGEASERTRSLTAALADGGLKASLSDQIQTLEWSKFVGWSGFSAAAALTRLETYKFLSDPDIARVAVRVMRETAQLPLAMGIPLADRPPLSSKAIAEGTEDEGVAVMQEVGAILRKRAPEMRQSTLQDLLRGRRVEIDMQLAWTLQQGAARDLPMPTIEICHRLIAGINRHLA